MQVAFNNIGSPENKAKLNAAAALNSDIITAVNSSFKQALEQTKAIAINFKGSTPLETCNNIWNFLRQEINYVKDPAGYQFIRQPRAFLAAKKGDCKSYSLFAAGILKNLYPDAEVFLRFAGYSSLNIPTHVYTVIAINGKKIICDGVYKYFSKEKKYTYKKDYKMKVYTLSGVSETETINGKGKLKGFFNKATTAVKTATTAVKNKVSPQAQAKKDAPKKLKDRIKGVVKKTVKGGKKIAFAPSRGSFLALVATNVRGLGTKVTAAIKEKPQDVKNIWEKVGGDFSQLQKTAASGAQKRRILGFEEAEGVGSAAAAGTAIASAAPIIVFFMDLFKKLRSPEANDSDTAFLTAESATALSDEGLSTADARAALETPQDDSATEGNNTPLLLGVGVVALLALGGGKLLK